MKLKLFILSIVAWLPFSFASLKPPVYKIAYCLKYYPDLRHPEKGKDEIVFLFTDGDEQSSYVAKNFLWGDSLLRQAIEGIISPYDVIYHPDYLKNRTELKHFIRKNYTSQELEVREKLFTNTYQYHQKNELEWRILSDTLSIKNYLCYKALTNYKGRDYEAWFTQEIPISDGPYKFWGLPGLILQIYDTDRHYNFTFQSIEKFDGKPFDIYFDEKKVFRTSYEQFKVLEKEVKENPLKAIQDLGVQKITVGGKEVDEAEFKRRGPKHNPIERW